MGLALGVDTGGTYTDAVILEDDTRVLARAKSLTTREDLARGIVASVKSVLCAAQVDPAQIGFAALSTTLATNALVEGQGEPVGLVTIGFDVQDMTRAGLASALGVDPHLSLVGGHTHSGAELEPLELGALAAWCARHDDLRAFAVAGVFATRNPTHEARVCDALREITGKPVSASHHLAAKLNGPKRALTALLNARLIGLISRLMSRAQEGLQALNIHAPLMIVRGDGALIAAHIAQERPIETILSGPAASIVGASWLTRAQHALVSDIGGTTTDIALLEQGKPRIDPQGAQVGEFRTMVEAVAMRTSGLGGDSEVHLASEGLTPRLSLGPRRAVPISLLAVEAGALVHKELDRQLASTVPSAHDGRFIRPHPAHYGVPNHPRDAALFERIKSLGVAPQSAILTSRMDHAALARLITQGRVQVAAVTPSDAAHVLERLQSWDAEAAQKAISLFARKRTGVGARLAQSPQAMAQLIVDQVTKQTRDLLLEAAFSEDTHFEGDPHKLVQNEILHKGLAGYDGLLRFTAALNLPVIGLGASAASYYPAVAEALNCEMILPEDAGVANAIGAVVGQVRITKTGTATSPSEGKIRIFLTDGAEDYADEAVGLDRLEAALRYEAERDAVAAGAVSPRLTATRDVQTAMIEGRRVFIEATVTVEAAGRPAFANPPQG